MRSAAPADRATAAPSFSTGAMGPAGAFGATGPAGAIAGGVVAAVALRRRRTSKGLLAALPGVLVR